MTADELRALLQAGTPLKLLDVREPDEFSAGDGLEGVENMPMGRIFLEAAAGRLPKDMKIVTVCKSGSRCEIVARELRLQGYDIDHLAGGIQAWNNSAPSL